MGRLDGYTELLERLFRARECDKAIRNNPGLQTEKSQHILAILYKMGEALHVDLADAVGSSYSSLSIASRRRFSSPSSLSHAAHRDSFLSSFWSIMSYKFVFTQDLCRSKDVETDIHLSGESFNNVLAGSNAAERQHKTPSVKKIFFSHARGNRFRTSPKSSTIYYASAGDCRPGHRFAGNY